MKTFWEIEREADILLKAAGFKTKRFSTRVRFNPNAPEVIREPMKGEEHYAESKATASRQQMMRNQLVRAEIKQRLKTDEKLA